MKPKNGGKRRIKAVLAKRAVSPKMVSPFVLSLLDAHLTPAVEKELLALGLEVDGVGLGSTEFLTNSKAVFNRVKAYLAKNKINVSV